MKILNNEIYFITASIIVGIVLYWASFTGTPIWDDSIFLFEHPIKDKDGFLKILLDYAWPVSVSIQKLELIIFGKNYSLYHITNFTLHFINSFLLYRLLKEYKITHARWIFLLFFFHPANVISVSWIIQLKTLLSFFFGILSLKMFLRSTEDEQKRLPYLFFCIILFGLSFFSKPSSVFLPLFFLLILIYKKQLKKYLPVLIILGFIALIGGYRTLDRGQSIISEVTPTQNLLNQSFAQSSTLLLKTNHYYFWQSVLPTDTAPIKGGVNYDLEMKHWIHLFFTIVLTLLCFKFHKLWPFLIGQIMMLPFSGLVAAPYMTLAWVSDQHLYLALPFFIFFFLRLVQSSKLKSVYFILPLLLSYYCVKTFQTNQYFKDEISFFEASLEHNPMNLAVILNLSHAYLQSHKGHLAKDLLDNIVEASKSDPSIRKNPYFPHLMILQMQLNQ